MERRLAEVGDVYAVPKRAGDAWTICQVVAEAPSGGLRVCAFDWLGDHVPDIEELQGPGPLEPGLTAVEVSDRLPPRRFVHLGAAMPLGATTDDPVSLGAFMRFGEELASAAHPLWRTDPEAIARDQARRKEAMAQSLSIALGPSATEVPAGADELNVIGPGGRQRLQRRPDDVVTGPFVLLDLGSTPAWQELDRLADLRVLRYDGADPGFVEYLAHNTQIAEALWAGHSRDRLDLSATTVASLIVDVDSKLELALPASLRTLEMRLRPGATTVRVEWLEGTPRLSDLWLVDPSSVDARGVETTQTLHTVGAGFDIARWTNLRQLRQLRVWAEGGGVEHLEALADFRDLEAVAIYDAYALDPDTFPLPDTWPFLDTIEFHGLATSHARLLRRRLADTYRLKISGVRSDGWLRRRQRNPFHTWVDTDPKMAKSAAQAYERARRAIERIGDQDAEALRPIVDRYARDFNRIDRTWSLETVERETIFDALAALTRPVGLHDQAEGWLDEQRTF